MDFSSTWEDIPDSRIDSIHLFESLAGFCRRQGKRYVVLANRAINEVDCHQVLAHNNRAVEVSSGISQQAKPIDIRRHNMGQQQTASTGSGSDLPHVRTGRMVSGYIG